MTSVEAQGRARKGARLLDQYRKGWALNLDPPDPQTSFVFDVLLELYGDHLEALKALGIDQGQELEHGFTEPPLDPDAPEDLPSEAESSQEEEAYQTTDDRPQWRWARDCYRLHTAWVSEIERRKAKFDREHN